MSGAEQEEEGEGEDAGSDSETEGGRRETDTACSHGPGTAQTREGQLVCQQ